jgi:hypothetical protein
MGNVIAPASAVMQNALPLARAGAGSAVQNTVRQVFGALGVAVIGTLLATSYASNVSSALTPLQDAERARAEDSIVETVGVLAQAGKLGESTDVIDQIRAGAFNAFLDASHLTAIISAAIVLLAAVVVVVALPHMRPPEDQRVEAEAAPATT